MTSDGPPTVRSVASYRGGWWWARPLMLGLSLAVAGTALAVAVKRDDDPASRARQVVAQAQVRVREVLRAAGIETEVRGGVGRTADDARWGNDHYAESAAALPGFVDAEVPSDALGALADALVAAGYELTSNRCGDVVEPSAPLPTGVPDIFEYRNDRGRPERLWVTVRPYPRRSSVGLRLSTETGEVRAPGDRGSALSCG